MACSLLLSSCSDYLDMLPDDQKTEQEVFSQYSSVNESVANAYDKTNGANRILTFSITFHRLLLQTKPKALLWKEILLTVSITETGV